MNCGEKHHEVIEGSQETVILTDFLQKLNLKYCTEVVNDTENSFQLCLYTDWQKGCMMIQFTFALYIYT